MAKKKLPKHLEFQRTRVSARSDAPHHTETVMYSGAYAALGVDNTVSLPEFRKDFKVEIINLTKEDIEFDMIGIDPSLANAFRRILIAELPTMAIETVFVANNTGVIHDEVLSHRLGLIPIQIDPRIFEYKSEHDTANEKNTVVFKLQVSCQDGSRLTVKSDQLKWLPNGSELLKSKDNPSDVSTSKPQTFTSFSCSQESLPGFPHEEAKLVPDDIIIAKLGPGQVIELEAHAVKGVGKMHAKWSPVATAWYRMLPEVVLLKEIEDEKAEELVNKCPAKVFEIEDLGADRMRATVARPRACTLCRECIRETGWQELVSLQRVKNHFIFKIESTGALPPEVLFTEAVKILEEKCESVLAEYSKLN